VNNIGSVSVLLNNGNGTFAAKVDYPAGTNPLQLPPETSTVMASLTSLLRTVV